METGRKMDYKKIINSKWTAVNVKNREKHFLVVEKIKKNDPHGILVDYLQIEAVLTKKIYQIPMEQIKDKSKWIVGWQTD